MKLTSQQVQEFIIAHYAPSLRGLSIDQVKVERDFDLLARGVSDSLGVLEMVGAIEEHFGISLDLEGLDAEQLTILGPLSDYVAKVGAPRSA